MHFVSSVESDRMLKEIRGSKGDLVALAVRMMCTDAGVIRINIRRIALLFSSTLDNTNCADSPQFPMDVHQAYFQASDGVLPLSGPELLPATQFPVH